MNRLAPLAAVAATLLLPPSPAGAEPWLPVAPMQTPRAYLGAAGPAGSASLYAVGGYNDAGTGRLATVRRYDPATNRWDAVRSMGVARSDLALVPGRTKLFAIGGDAGGATNVVEAYNPALNRWSRLAPMPTPRARMAAALIGDTLFVMGGVNGTAYQDAVEAFDTVAEIWWTRSPLRVPLADMAAVTVISDTNYVSGTIYLMGGSTAPDSATKGVAAYYTALDLWSGTWTGLRQLGKARAALTAFTVPPQPYAGTVQVYAAGGDDLGIFGPLPDVESWDPQANTPWAVAPALPAGLRGAAAVAMSQPSAGNYYLYVTGGDSTALIRDETRIAYHQSSCVLCVPCGGCPVWSATTTMGAPRTRHGAANLGGKLYVAGGRADHLDAVEVLETVSGTWTTATAMPTGRSGLALARSATGRKLYAVGGTGGTELAASEAYDPATDTWAARAPLPTRRRFLAAAFSGGTLYAIGGLLSGTPLSANEAYDPVADTWTTRADMPVARFLPAVAPLPGGRIAVFGGATVLRNAAAPPPRDVVPSYLDTVEIYDPATDAWTTAAPMPVPRAGAGAASPDGELIYLAGGFDGKGTVSGVDRYDPVRDAWLPRVPMNDARMGLALAVPGASTTLYAIGGVRTDAGSLALGGAWVTSGTLHASAEAHPRHPAALTVVLTPVPARLEPGPAATVTLTGAVTNEGDVTATVFTVAIGPDLGDRLIAVAGGPLPLVPVALRPGTATAFTVRITVTGTGLVGFSMTVTGEEWGTAAPLSATDWTDYPVTAGRASSLAASLALSPLPLVAGTEATLVLTVANAGGGTAYDGAPSAEVVSGQALLTIRSGPLPSGTVTIWPGTSVAFTWTLAVSAPGYAGVRASGTWLDPILGAVTAGATRFTQPASPRGLTARQGDGRVFLAWAANPPEEGVGEYRVYRRDLAEAAFTYLGSSSGTWYTDATAVNGRRYVYRLTAVSAGGEGPPSAEVAAAPLALPGTPGDVWITATGVRPLAANPARGERAQVLLNVPAGGATMRLAVYTLVGEPVKVLFDGPAPPGTAIVEWDGTNERGRLVASGGYLLVADLPDGRRVRRKIAIVK